MSEHINFTMPHLGGDKRAPSYFAAACLYSLTALGLTFMPFLTGAVQTLCAVLLPGLDTSFFSALTQVCFYSLCIIIPLYIYLKNHSGMSDAMRFNGITTRRAILCVMAGVMGLFFTNFVSYIWFMLVEGMGGRLVSGTNVPTTPSQLCQAIVFSAILPGVCEELVFRGAILSAWERGGSKRAVLVSACLFATLHASIGGLPSELINGIILAIIAVSTDSLFACMIYHTVFNSTALILAYVAQAQAAAETAEVSASLFASIGGMAGLIPLLFDILITGAALFITLRALDRIRLFEGRRVFGNEEGVRHNWRWSELGVLFSGVGVMAMWYVYDLMKVMGVIR